jgi:hypothetical protein
MSADGLQREGTFAQAVLDARAAVPTALAGRDGRSPERRFAVYRNNVFASLINLLAGRFPATAKLVGDEFFWAMAREYVEKTPPNSAVLLLYGAEFPDFIGDFPPASSVPYLADVARLEMAWHRAYHAADAEPLSQEAFVALGPRVEEVVLSFHPSASLVRSSYPVIAIWERTMRDGDDEPVQLPFDGEDALVLRPALQVAVRRLPPGGAVFIAALMAGAKMRVAAAAALDQTPEFDLAANLAGLMWSGALVGTR